MCVTAAVAEIIFDVSELDVTPTVGKG